MSRSSDRKAGGDGGWETWEWDETLFEGAAEYYERGRVPYTQALIDAFGSTLGLDGRGRLLDVGCGPGSIALRLAHLFAEVVGLDPDPGMLEAARHSAERRGITNVRWMQARAEALPAGLGLFRLITFAQSFHWMDRPKVAAAVLTMLDPDGVVVQVDNAGDDPNSWPDEPLLHPRVPEGSIEELRRRWLGTDKRAGQSIRNTSPSGEDAIFQAAGFGPCRLVRANDRRVIERTIDDVVAERLSSSGYAPHLFGTRLPEFEAELRAVLAAASPSGLFSVPVPDSGLRIWAPAPGRMKPPGEDE